MSDQFHFLDLPDLALEQILSYCQKSFGEQRKINENPLLNLTECCKFLKNYIETNPRLMRRLTLRVPINCEWFRQSVREVEKFGACLNSTRPYSVVKFYFTYSPMDDDVDELDFKNKKFLADMYSETIKDVTFSFDLTETDSIAVLNILSYLENLINVEKVTVIFNWFSEDAPTLKREFLEKHSGWNWSDYGVSYSFPNKFEHLKQLKMEPECQTVFNIFANCKTIETLELTRFGSEKPVNYDKLQLLLENSRESLKTLKVDYDFEDEFNFYDFNDFLEAFINSGIDLKNFELSESSSNSETIKFLLQFLGSQKNLEKLVLNEIPVKIISNKFNEEIAKLVKLKMLKISFVENENSSDDEGSDPENYENDGDQIDVLFTMPKLLELEELDLCYSHQEKYDLSFRMSLFKSDKLKKIKIWGPIKFRDSFFEDISKNFSSLIEFEIAYENDNYSSNDIFWILKHLKQLKKLKFVFPVDSELNPDLFDNNGDLNLPVIENVYLKFNNSVTIDHVMKFVQLMNNMSSFSFKCWRNFNPDLLVLVTKELPHLNNLGINEYLTKIPSSVLLKIQSNLQEFNKGRSQFRINRMDLSFWMEKAYRNEAGGSEAKKLKVNFVE